MQAATVDQRLDAALSRLRLIGAIFLWSEFSESWAYESLPARTAADVLHPGAERVLIFHVVATGRCWVATPGGERLWATEGDVIVLPYGAQHRIGGVDAAECVSIGELLAPPPWSTLPRIAHGGGGAQTSILCGYLHSDDALFNPDANVFPDAFVVHPPTGAAADWVRSSIEYAMTQISYESPTDGKVPTRLPEFLLIEVLRLYLATAPGADRDWLSALADPVLGPAMAAMHGRPEHKWTVVELAEVASVSRSALDERFRVLLGRSPIRYLNEWRMHAAQDLLATTDLTVAAVGRRVGYDAEEAFSRAFKRNLGQSPAGWRASRRA